MVRVTGVEHLWPFLLSQWPPPPQIALASLASSLTHRGSLLSSHPRNFPVWVIERAAVGGEPELHISQLANLPGNKPH